MPTRIIKVWEVKMISNPKEYLDRTRKRTGSSAKLSEAPLGNKLVTFFWLSCVVKSSPNRFMLIVVIVVEQNIKAFSMETGTNVIK